MDTREALNRGEFARSRGAKMNYFDGGKIKILMKAHLVTEAFLFLSEDRGYTESTVRLIKGKLEADDIGVDGSIWAEPTLEIENTLYKVGTYKKSKTKIKWIKIHYKED